MKYKGYADTDRTLRNIGNTLRVQLEEQYGINDVAMNEKILKIHGLHTDDFDFVTKTQKLITGKLNDESSDPNASKNEKTISGILAEVTSSVNKAVGYDYLYREMKADWGKQEAKELSGLMYDYTLPLHDSSKILIPYCYSFDASHIVFEGRPFGQLKSKPPKSILSYIASLNETIHQMSNHLAGAIAVGSFFSDLAFILINREHISLEKVNKDKATRKYIENAIQTHVHSVNHLSRLTNESPFTNLSIFDRPKLEALFADSNMGWILNTDEGEIDKDYFFDFITELQDIFVDFFDKGDPSENGMPYRFPVVTMNLSKDADANILDEPFFDKLCEREIFRYNEYSSEGTKVASCCFDGNEDCVIRTSDNGVQRITLKEAYETPRNGNNFRVYHNGSFVKGNPVKIPVGLNDMYKIKTANNKEFITTGNHLNVTLNGDKPTERLTVDDYLMFNTTRLDGKASNQVANVNYTKEVGVLIGAYLGDGSNYEAEEGQNHVIYSLNKNKKDMLAPLFEKALKDLDIEANMCVNEQKNNCWRIAFYNNEVHAFIKKFVSGNYSYDKSLSMQALNESVDFREGIIEGYYLTDGGNSNRIYSTSKALIDDMEVIFNSIGKATIIDCEDRTNEKVLIRGQEFNRNYPSYTIRWYDRANKRSQKDVYKYKNGNMYFKVTSIEKVENYDKDDVYCFEMRDKNEPYFTLASGLVTHNCRLLSDTEMFELGGQVNSFGGSALSLGSHRVSLVHTNRLALMTNNSKEFYELLDKRIEQATKILVSHRHLLANLENAGLQMFLSLGWLSLRKMFSTIGLIGLPETVANVKGTDMKELLTFVNDKVNEMSLKYEIPMNIEQVPAESMAVRLVDVDKMLFGEEKVPYQLYSNQFIPLWEDATIYERMEIDGKYNKMFTGGGIVHFNLKEKPTPQQNRKVIKFAVKSGCEHFAENAVYSKCENGHTTFTVGDVCPECKGQVIERLTRVVGFFTPVSSWNPVRREWEFPRRTPKSIE